MPSPSRPVSRLLTALAALVLVAACSSGAPKDTIPPVGSIGPSGSPAASGSPGTSGSASPSESHPAEASYPPGCPTKQPAPLPAGQTRTVTLTTDKGDIVIKVDGSLAPIAAGNFVALVECHFYDGIVFHRLIPKFIIQAGDGTYGRQGSMNPDYVGYGQLPYQLPDEPVTKPYTRGTVAMARSKEGADSQFFIVLDDSANDTLGAPKGPNNYQVFGTVTTGMDVVDAIAGTPNSGSPNFLATNPVAIDRATAGS